MSTTESTSTDSKDSKFNSNGSYHYYGINNNNNVPKHKSLNATDDESLRALFRPGLQNMDNYDLRLAHQRINSAFDRYLGHNNVKAGIELFEKVKDDGPIEAMARAALYTLRASLTLDKEQIDFARECNNHGAKLCKKLMKHSFLESISKWVITPNYDKYTDVEIYAEFYYAQHLCLHISLYAMETNSVFTLIKLAYYLRGLVRTYTNCWQIKKKRTNWESEEAKVYFEAHMRFANGVVNIVISHTPPKFLRIMNFLGYKGQESFGLSEVNRVAFEMNASIMSKMAQLFLIYYWVYAKPHGENIPDDLSLCKQLVEAELQLFPESMLYGLAKAKIEQINGNFDCATETLNNLLNAKNLPIARKAFYFELIWCYAIKCDWDNCIRCSEMIRSSKHSPVCTAFLNAVFRYVKGVEINDQKLLDQATQEFELIPSLRIRHFGKTMTTEKAAITNAQLYFKKGKRLMLPIVAMLYSGNYLTFIRNKDELSKLMERVEREVKRYEKDFETEECLDDYLTALFYKAVFLRLMNKYQEARDCLDIILKEKSRIDLETSIVPLATLEMGLIEMEQGNNENATEWFHHAEKDYSGYTAENFVNIKVYAAIRRMGYKTDKQSEDKEKLNRHIKNWLKFHEIDVKSYNKIISSDKV